MSADDHQFDDLTPAEDEDAALDFHESAPLEEPVGIAGVTPTIDSFCSASSTRVKPKTSWNPVAEYPCKFV